MPELYPCDLALKVPIPACVWSYPAACGAEALKSAAVLAAHCCSLFREGPSGLGLGLGLGMVENAWLKMHF